MTDKESRTGIAQVLPLPPQPETVTTTTPIQTDEQGRPITYWGGLATPPDAGPTPAWTCTHGAEMPWRCPDCLIRELSAAEQRNAELEDALNMATQGKYSELMLKLASGVGKIIAAEMQVCTMKGDIATLTAQLAEAKARADQERAWKEDADENSRQTEVRIAAERKAREAADHQTAHFALQLSRAETVLEEAKKHERKLAQRLKNCDEILQEAEQAHKALSANWEAERELREAAELEVRRLKDKYHE